jgi:hypothetical protein
MAVMELSKDAEEAAGRAYYYLTHHGDMWKGWAREAEYVRGKCRERAVEIYYAAAHANERGVCA